MFVSSSCRLRARDTEVDFVPHDLFIRESCKRIISDRGNVFVLLLHFFPTTRSRNLMKFFVGGMRTTPRADSVRRFSLSTEFVFPDSRPHGHACSKRTVSATESRFLCDGISWRFQNFLEFSRGCRERKRVHRKENSSRFNYR